ncbi:MAG: hypothetical protein AAFV98_19385 [Chloroflexota bacterium]
MAFELEALVGHMYVAGGRTIKTTPPGSLCEVAPKRAVRGREIDTLFVLVLPSGNIAPNTFYEQMSLMAAERYFSNTGSVTSAMRDVFNTLNNNLFEHNTSGRKHYEANMIIAVMRGTDLYVARAGAATLVLRHDGEIKAVPETLTDDDKLFKPPLGVQPIPEVELGRFVLDSGSRMILADSSIAEITSEKLEQSLLVGNIEDVLDEFKLLVTLQIQMMVVEFVPPEQPVMVPAATGQSSAVIAAEVAAARAKTASERAKTIVDTDTPPEAVVPETRKRATPQDRLKKRFQGMLISMSRGLGHSMTRIGNLIHIFFGSESTPKQRRRNTAVIASAVFAIPLLLVGTVMFSWVGNVGETQYEECVGRAQNAADVARGLDANPASSRDGSLNAWSATLTIIDECRAYRPEYVDINLDTLRREAQFAVDTMSSITRRQTTPIWASPDEDANIRELVLQGVDSIYAFDNANSIVYRLQLNESGTSVIDQQPIQFMSIGARVEGNTVGRIVGIAYHDDNDVIGALDENGLLVTCRPLAINQCDSQQLVDFQLLLLNPVRMTFWEDNLYVLDTGAEQIWRFTPISGTDNYANRPTEYYSGDVVPPNLDEAVDFAIGSSGATINGHVYTLFSNGTMAHHFSGRNEGFSYRGLPAGLESPEETVTQAMFLNDSNLFTGFYIISRPLRTIYYFTTAGTFQNAFRIEDETHFERLNDVVADPEQNVVYAASGNAIFAFNASR